MFDVDVAKEVGIIAAILCVAVLAGCRFLPAENTPTIPSETTQETTVETTEPAEDTQTPSDATEPTIPEETEDPTAPAITLRAEFPEEGTVHLVAELSNISREKFFSAVSACF